MVYMPWLRFEGVRFRARKKRRRDATWRYFTEKRKSTLKKMLETRGMDLACGRNMVVRRPLICMYAYTYT